MSNRVLTVLQDRILAGLFGAGLSERGFFLTGGTALSAYYLEHRYSDDLDFFTRRQDSLEADFETVASWLTEQSLEIVNSEVYEAFARFFIRAAGDDELGPAKIEFARDVPAAMAPPRTFGAVVVDSLEDIAVNKVCAILGREPPETKDFVDLYFILGDTSFSLEYLVARAREKEAAFDSPDGVLFFATNLLRVTELQLLPRMIRPIDLPTLRARLVPLAEDLIRSLRRRPPER